MPLAMCNKKSRSLLEERIQQYAHQPEASQCAAHQGSGGAWEGHHEREVRGWRFQARTRVNCGGLFAIVFLNGVNVSTLVPFIRFDQ